MHERQQSSLDLLRVCLNMPDPFEGILFVRLNQR